jgi:integrase/recombinase XerD
MNWQQAIKDYQNYLKIERGLSQNSISNYTMDLQKLVNYLNEQKIEEKPIGIDRETVQQFIYDIAKIVNPRTQVESCPTPFRKRR